MPAWRSYSSSLQGGKQRSCPGAVSATIDSSGTSGAVDHNDAPTLGWIPCSARVRAALKRAPAELEDMQVDALAVRELLDAKLLPGAQRERGARRSGEDRVEAHAGGAARCPGPRRPRSPPARLGSSPLCVGDGRRRQLVEVRGAGRVEQSLGDGELVVGQEQADRHRSEDKMANL